MKKYLKRLTIAVFSKFMQQNEIKLIINDLVRDANVTLPRLQNRSNPYASLDEIQEDRARFRSDIVFVTGRFRSGSTVLWNLFRQIDGCTAFYEPFNERQWFSTKKRGENVDKTHIGVDDYWAEYEGLNELSELYNEDWTRYNLFMDKKSWNPSMLKFIESIINSTSSIPVLQFNRIVFRLDWIKHDFPNAKILHLYRHPRDQWISFLLDKKLMNRRDVEFTYVDNFYLNSWCHDLSVHFPFLKRDETPHPYRRFYYLWKLSFLFGEKCADLSIDYESLATAPNKEIQKIFTALDWSLDPKNYSYIFKSPTQDKWREYADDDWFVEHELYCEKNLRKYFDTM
jgi:hypothetical protein